MKTSRAEEFLLSRRDLDGIRPGGRLAALLRNRRVRGPRWVLVRAALLSPRPMRAGELAELADPGPLSEALNRGWSDWLLSEKAWRAVLAEGISNLRERIRWCRRESPPRRNRTSGARREEKLHRALDALGREIDAAADPGRGAQAEGLFHPCLLEDVLESLGYRILANPVGVPDIRAERREAGEGGGLRERIEAWHPRSAALARLREALLDLTPGDLAEIRRLLDG